MVYTNYVKQTRRTIQNFYAVFAYSSVICRANFKIAFDNLILHFYSAIFLTKIVILLDTTLYLVHTFWSFTLYLVDLLDYYRG